MLLLIKSLLLIHIKSIIIETANSPHFTGIRAIAPIKYYQFDNTQAHTIIAEILNAIILGLLINLLFHF